MMTNNESESANETPNEVEPQLDDYDLHVMTPPGGFPSVPFPLDPEDAAEIEALGWGVTDLTQSDHFRKMRDYFELNGGLGRQWHRPGLASWLVRTTDLRLSHRRYMPKQTRTRP